MEGIEKREHPPVPILNEWDKKVLEQGLPNIVKAMYKDFGNSLPDAIIFPDTSARPLFYTLNPIFKEISRDKGIPLPRCYFFAARRPSVWLGEYEKLRAKTIADMSDEERSALDPVQLKETIDTNEEMEGYLRGIQGMEDVIHIRRTLSYDDAGEMRRARSTMKTRAEEILTEETKRTQVSPKIAIIDDVASPDSHTVSEIRRAFGMRELPAYVVATYTDPHEDRELDGSITAGYIADLSTDVDDRNQSKQNVKFSYAGTDALGVNKFEDEEGAFLRKHAILIETENPEELSAEKRQLRSEMSAIGEKIAARIIRVLDGSAGFPDGQPVVGT